MSNNKGSKHFPNKLTTIDRTGLETTDPIRLHTKSVRFAIAISGPLDSGYCFKSLKESAIKQFHNFINETVDKGLSISQVDAMFRRKSGPDGSVTINGCKFEEIHYGKDRKAFRVYGYYRNDGFFHLTAIDPNHNRHKC